MLPCFVTIVYIQYNKCLSDQINTINCQNKYFEPGGFLTCKIIKVKRILDLRYEIYKKHTIILPLIQLTQLTNSPQGAFTLSKKSFPIQICLD